MLPHHVSPSLTGTRAWIRAPESSVLQLPVIAPHCWTSPLSTSPSKPPGFPVSSRTAQWLTPEVHLNPTDVLAVEISSEASVEEQARLLGEEDLSNRRAGCLLSKGDCGELWEALPLQTCFLVPTQNVLRSAGVQTH